MREDDDDEDLVTAETPLIPQKEDRDISSKSSPHNKYTATLSGHHHNPKNQHTLLQDSNTYRKSNHLNSSTSKLDLINENDEFLDSNVETNNNNNRPSRVITSDSYPKSKKDSEEYRNNPYPNDSFSRLDGKSPKPSTKMATNVDAIGKITGQWGKWQLRAVLLIFLCKIPSSWFMACIIFTAPAPRHGEFYCKPPNTVEAQNHTAWIKVSHPTKEEEDDHEFNIDFCNVYQDAQEHAHIYYHYTQQDNEPKLWEEPTRNSTVIPCNAFEHKSEYHSIITEYDLVCSRDILVALTQFFHLFGVLTGGLLATSLLKYWSPRNVMFFGMVTQIFCGTMTGHVASYELHVFFRCLSAVCCCQMYTAGAMIFSDITGGTYKTVIITLFEQFWSIGVILLPGVSSFFQSWTHIYMAISWPTVILMYLWKWIPDSPRWMLARGRIDEAKKILLECVEVNGTQHRLPHDIDKQLEHQAIECMQAPPPAGWWSIWKGEKAVRHMICVHLCWSIYIVVYYGMLLNIRSFSRDHLEINTVIAGASEIVGTFIGLFFILKTTRKWQWTGLFNIVAAAFAYLAWFIPQEPEITKNERVALLMLSAMISKAAISCTLAILTTCTTELVPDEKKKICAFSTIVWARIWLLTAPFVGALIVFGQLVPQSAFATLSIIGGILSMMISSPRTIPLKKTHIDVDTDHTNYNANIQMNNNSPFKKDKSDLPPQMAPGIWTTKAQDIGARI